MFLALKVVDIHFSIIYMFFLIFSNTKFKKEGPKSGMMM